MFLNAIVPGDRTPYTRHRVTLTRSPQNHKLRLAIESYIQDELGRVEIGPLQGFSLRRYPEIVGSLLTNQTPVRIRHEVLADMNQIQAQHA